MTLALRRRARVYGAIAAMVPKTFLAYTIWVWMNWFTQIVALIIFVFFWRAVYANTNAINGLTLGQTLTYVLLARLLSPLVENTNTISFFGSLLRDGQLSMELLRPLDFQAGAYAQRIANLLMDLALQLPIALVAIVFFRLRVTLDPLVWLSFVVTALLGFSTLFFFDWIIGCLAFYITEIWGLSVLRYGVSNLFSGLLLPLVLLPDGFRQVAEALPFAQALYLPVSILSGITPLSDVPRLWLQQVVWLVSLLVLSRFAFSRAVRKVTVQGG